MMEVDVLLLQPRFGSPTRAWMYPTCPPLGLGYIAAVLEDKLETRIRDMNISTATPQEETVEIMKLKPKVLGISVNTPSLPLVYEMVRELRKGSFTGSILMGGPHITTRPEIVGFFEDVVGLRGEAEVCIDEVCNQLIEGGNIREDICCRDMIVDDLKQLPPPARHLFQNDKYHFIVSPILI